MGLLTHAVDVQCYSRNSSHVVVRHPAKLKSVSNLQIMIPRRTRHLIEDRLAVYPAVALIGPRQCGKTTLARPLGGSNFDLEQEADHLLLDLELDRCPRPDVQREMSAGRPSTSLPSWSSFARQYDRPGLTPPSGPSPD